MTKQIYIIIATAFYRKDLLINRSLKSVYRQIIDNKQNIKVFIVDDNEISQIVTLKIEIEKLRTKLNLNHTEYETFVIPNTKTKFHSGTGAWNTGIFYIKNFDNWKNSFIAILDDDDEWLPDYLQTCYKAIIDNTNIIAVFCQLIWRNENHDLIHELTQEKLNQREFFIGNPGVQGSNMFIKSMILHKINGFNENYPSTTDRELMIRFLDFVEFQNKTKTDKLSCKVVEKPLVIHYNHKQNKVNNDFSNKKNSLDMFYKEYKNRFSDADFSKSLERAKLYFNYEYFATKL